MGINLFIGFCIGLFVGTIFSRVVEYYLREHKKIVHVKEEKG